MDGSSGVRGSKGTNGIWTFSSDAITPGRRSDYGNICDVRKSWAFEPGLTDAEFYPRLISFVACFVTRWTVQLLLMSVPEMILYPLTFRHILSTTNMVALRQILSPEVIKRRKEQNSLNIYLTFLNWLAQFVTNMLLIVMRNFMFGQNLLLHGLFALLHLTINFSVLPIFYVIAADDEIKKALSERNFVRVFRLLLSFDSYNT